MALAPDQGAGARPAGPVSSADLEAQVGHFEHCNHAGYRESLDNLTPADVYLAMHLCCCRQCRGMGSNLSRVLSVWFYGRVAHFAGALVVGEPHPPVATTRSPELVVRLV